MEGSMQMTDLIFHLTTPPWMVRDCKRARVKSEKPVRSYCTVPCETHWVAYVRVTAETLVRSG